jgi:hypothetical protein
MMTMKISDDMIIPVINRGFNHGRTNLKGSQFSSENHFRPANHHTGIAEFWGPCLVGDVGARMGESCDSSHLCNFRLLCSAHKGEKA